MGKHRSQGGEERRFIGRGSAGRGARGSSDAGSHRGLPPNRHGGIPGIGALCVCGSTESEEFQRTEQIGVRNERRALVRSELVALERPAAIAHPVAQGLGMGGDVVALGGAPHGVVAEHPHGRRRGQSEHANTPADPNDGRYRDNRQENRCPQNDMLSATGGCIEEAVGLNQSGEVTLPGRAGLQKIARMFVGQSGKLGAAECPTARGDHAQQPQRGRIEGGLLCVDRVSRVGRIIRTNISGPRRSKGGGRPTLDPLRRLLSRGRYDQLIVSHFKNTAMHHIEHRGYYVVGALVVPAP